MDKISDLKTDLPHMLPTEKAFAAAVDALTIQKDTQVHPYFLLQHSQQWMKAVIALPYIAVLNASLKSLSAAKSMHFLVFCRWWCMIAVASSAPPVSGGLSAPLDMTSAAQTLDTG